MSFSILMIFMPKFLKMEHKNCMHVCCMGWRRCVVGGCFFRVTFFPTPFHRFCCTSHWNFFSCHDLFLRLSLAWSVPGKSYFIVLTKSGNKTRNSEFVHDTCYTLPVWLLVKIDRMYTYYGGLWGDSGSLHIYQHIQACRWNRSVILEFKYMIGS